MASKTNNTTCSFSGEDDKILLRTESKLEGKVVHFVVLMPHDQPACGYHVGMHAFDSEEDMKKFKDSYSKHCAGDIILNGPIKTESVEAALEENGYEDEE